MASLEIPDKSGAILLPDCTLFPHGALPLHIFEIRYREMLAEALEGDCLFAVARLTGDETFDPADCTAPVGTIGLIRASREQGDGHSNLLLHGVCRVRFLEWVPEKPYPYARIEPVASLQLPEAEAIRQTKRLRETVENLILGFPDQVVSQVRGLLDRIDDAPILADAIAQQFVQDPDLRQDLLEEPEVGRRIDLLVDYLRTLRSGEN